MIFFSVIVETEEVLNIVSSDDQKSIEVALNSSSDEELVSNVQPGTSPVNSQMASDLSSLTLGPVRDNGLAVAAAVSQPIISSQKVLLIIYILF